MNNEFGKMIEEKIQEIVAERMGNNEAIIKTMLPPQHIIDILKSRSVVWSLDNKDMTWVNMVAEIVAATAVPHVHCENCGWMGQSDEVLTAENPFDKDFYVCGCPNCKAIDSIRDIPKNE